MPPPSPRSLGSCIAARLLLLFGLAAWPALWFLSAWLHLRLCGVGLTAFACDEPLTDVVVHQLMVTLGPWLSVVLVAWAAEFDKRR